jgi:predicted Zn-dependent protease
MTTPLKCLLIAGLALAFAGCTPYSEQQQRPPVESPKPEATKPVTPPSVVQPQPGVVPRPTPGVSLNPAAISLAKQARGQYQAQDYQGAIATAERGLRIERRAPDLYLVLAQSYLQLDQPQKAAMFAQQGLRFAPQGSDVASGLLQTKELSGN